MEKSAAKIRFRRFSRLLVIFSLLLLSSSSLWAHIYSQYEFKPVDEYIFEGQDSTFEVVIPNLKPVEIKVTAQNLARNVTFISSDTTEIIDENNERCTRVRVTYRFKKAGDYKMAPIMARIKYYAYNLKVVDVKVLHNPQTIQPLVQYKLLDEDKKTYKVGEKIPLQLTVSFASRIDSYSVNILENSAMQKTQENFELPLKINHFSDTAFPIASFIFIPLKEGKIQLPQISVKTKTWKGGDKIALSEPMTFYISGSIEEKPASIKRNFHSENTVEKSEVIVEKMLTQEEIQERSEDIKNIAKLRIAERKKLFPFAVSKDRIALEKKIGINRSENEFTYVNIVISLLLFALVLVLLIVMSIKKKKPWIIILSILLFLLAVCILVCVLFISKEYALTLDEKIYSVPEELSNAYFTLNPGTRVEIRGSTKDWLFVTYGETTAGWIRRENLIFLHLKN
ncbi:MAG: hypothetical protein K5839_06355 [Treponemataceae bacterium]|nr:hypothetical protein [Treponemataceae bacterium]